MYAKSQLGCQVHSNLDSFKNVYNGVQTLAPQGINFFNMSNALLLNQMTWLVKTFESFKGN